ncbi:MAG: putative superfamily protein [Verrucomicrobiales bacterium]|nr:putative superfamily protein [Verrucomicrobiales bacterium]
MANARTLLPLLTLTLAIVLPLTGRAEKLKTENVFLIMCDGLRWQEVFGGADEQLLNATHGGVKDANQLRSGAWRDTAEERRAILLPFFWNEIAQRGQLFGNTNKGSIAQLTNGKKFSYPGYNEVITGVGDPRIDSNDKNPNPNVSVFEWLNQKPRFAKRTAVFGNWDVFAYIFNCERSGLPIWPVWESKFGKYKTKVAPEIEDVFENTTTPWMGGTMDSFISRAAHDYVKQKQPRLLFVGFGETDEWAHERRYDNYLSAAHNMDSSVRRLWDTVQSMSQYRNKTTFIITCDHGRGSNERNWTDHGRSVTGAENIWLAVLGPDTAALGERVQNEPIAQNQIAATLATFLGQDFHAAFPNSGAPIRDVLPRR